MFAKYISFGRFSKLATTDLPTPILKPEISQDLQSNNIYYYVSATECKDASKQISSIIHVVIHLYEQS